MVYNQYMPYADPERKRAYERSYKRAHREEEAARGRLARKRKREGYVRPSTIACSGCGESVVVPPNGGPIPRYCTMACRLATDPEYAEGERIKERQRTSRRLGRPVLPFRPAAPRYRQLSMMDELPDAERRLIAYASRDRQGKRERMMLAARAAGRPPKGESILNMIRRLKGSNPCMDCGVVYPFYVMQFDHRPGEAKSFILSKAKNKTRAEVEAEIAKCDLVCANCHSIRTYERVIRRPKVVRIKTCARCGRGYAGPYAEHAKDRDHIASLGHIKGAA